MLDFEALAQAMSRQTVLCIGDLMLDEFVYGEVSRISPEAPAPVIAARRSETNIGGAGNVARNIASLGGRCIFVGLIGEDEVGRQVGGHAGAAARHRERAGARSGAADHAQGALRLRAFLHPYAARRLGAGTAGIRRDRAEADRRGAAADCARRHRAAVGLCQGRADRAGDPQCHRRREKARQARDRRSQERQPGDLSRRDVADAEPQGICRGDPQPRRQRRQHCRSRTRCDGSRRLRGDAGDPKRARHDTGHACRRIHPRPGAAGQGAGCLRRRRYSCGRACARACRRRRLGNRAAGGEPLQLPLLSARRARLRWPRTNCAGKSCRTPR